MATARLKTVTAQYLSPMSVETRKATLRHLRTWQKFCDTHGFHVLDGRVQNAEAFADHLRTTYTPKSAFNRFVAVRAWFDLLARERVIKAHGFGAVEFLSPDITPKPVRILPDAALERIMEAAKGHGPRVEWLMGMLCFAGVDISEACQVRSTDIRTWEGRTLVRIRTSSRLTREVPVNGRLEVLTLGLAAVFAPTTRLVGTNRPKANEMVREITLEALGEPYVPRELRRTAIERQLRRGVDLAVVARWLGYDEVGQLRRLIGQVDPVALVTDSDVVEKIVVEDDGDRFGSGSAPDVLLDSGDDEGTE